jgi:hypothetical protein
MSRLRTSATIAALCLCLAGSAARASPAAAGAGAHVGPNQFFFGVINGHLGNAPIFMRCVGPIRPGETGHPMPNQYMEVHPEAGPLPGGYTGSAADHIFAYFVLPTPIPQGVNLTNYEVKIAIPTKFTLPCSGRGTVNFSPQPTSSTARSELMSVTFIGQP